MRCGNWLLIRTGDAQVKSLPLEYALAECTCGAIGHRVRDSWRLRQDVIRIEACRGNLGIVECGVDGANIRHGEALLRDHRRAQQLSATGHDPKQLQQWYRADRCATNVALVARHFKSDRALQGVNRVREQYRKAWQA